MQQKIAILLLIIYSSVSSQELTNKKIISITSQIPKLILENYVLNDKKTTIANAFSLRVKSKKYY